MTANALAWSGPSGGAWSNPANWQDLVLTAPAALAPGLQNAVSILGGTTAAMVVLGDGSAASLAISALVSLSGTIGIGAALSVGSRTLIGTGAQQTAVYATGTLTLAAGTIGAGSLSISKGAVILAAGTSMTASNGVSLGSVGGFIIPYSFGMLYDRGGAASLSIGAGASLVDGGGLVISAGLVSVNGGTAFVAGAVTLGTAASGTASPGTNAASANLVITGGGRVTLSNALTVAYGSVEVTDAGSRVAVAGTLTLGTAAALTFTSGGLLVANGASLQVAGLVLDSSASGASGPVALSVSIDAASAMEVGPGGQAVIGRLVIDAGALVLTRGTDTILPAITNNGAIVVAGGTLSLRGAMSGSGVIGVGTGATLIWSGAGQTHNAISFTGTGDTLEFGTASGFAGPRDEIDSVVSFFQTGDSLILHGSAVTAITYAAASAGLGTLTFRNGTATVTALTLAGDFSGKLFTLGTIQGAGGKVTLQDAGPPVFAPPSVVPASPLAIGHGQTARIAIAVAGQAGDTLSIVVDTIPALGSLSLASDGGSVLFTAAADGVASFAYHLADNHGDVSTEQTGTVTIDPGPVLLASALVLQPGQSADLAAIVLRAAHPGLAQDTLTVSAIGTLLLAGGHAVVAAPASGSAQFFATVTDGWGDTASATITVASASAAMAGLSVTAALAAKAAGTLAAGTWITDTASAVSGNLDQLETLSQSGLLAGIALRDGGRPDLAVTTAQLQTDAAALALIGTAVRLDPKAVVESAAAVVAGLDALQARWQSGTLGQITLTDGGTPVLAMSAASLAADAGALAQITTPYGIRLTDPGTPTINLPAWAATSGIGGVVLAHVTTPFTASAAGPVDVATALQLSAQALPAVGLAVIDTPEALGAQLDALQAIAGGISAISAGGGGVQILSLTAQQLSGDATALSHFVPGFALSEIIAASQCDNATLDPGFTSFTVQDSVANVITHLDAIDTLARSGRLARLRTTQASPDLSLTAAQVSRDAIGLSFLIEQAPPITLTDSGTPTITLTADSLASPLVLQNVLGAIDGAYRLTIAGPVSGALLATITQLYPAILSALTPVTVRDTAANLVALLPALLQVEQAGKLAEVDLLDGGVPQLKLTAAAQSLYLPVLGRIATPYLAGGATGSPFVGYAWQFTAYLDYFQILARAGQLDGVYLVDAAPTLTLSVATLSADILALSQLSPPFTIDLTGAAGQIVSLPGWAADTPAIVALLMHVQTAFQLSVTGAVRADTAQRIAAAGLVLAIPLQVVDSTAAVGAALDALQNLAAAGMLASISLTDITSPPVLMLGAAQQATDARALAAITGPYALSELVTAAGAASPPGPAFTSLTVLDSTANILSAMPALTSGTASGMISKLLLQDGTTLTISAATFAANAFAISAIANLTQITLTDSGVPAIALPASTLGLDAFLGTLSRIVGPYSLTILGQVSAMNAASLVLSGGSPRANLAQGGVSVRDSADHIAAFVDALRTLADTGQLGSITMPGAMLAQAPTLSLTSGQLATDSQVLAHIAGPYRLSQVITIAQIGTALAAGFQGFTVEDNGAVIVPALVALGVMARAGTLDRLTFTGPTPLIHISSADLLAGLDALAAIDARNLSIILTDLGPKQLAIPATALDSANIRSNVLGAIVGAVSLTVLGPATATALAAVMTESDAVLTDLAAPVAVADTAANVLANLDALSAAAQAGKLASITLIDGAKPSLSLTEAQYVGDAAALAAIVSPFAVSVKAVPAAGAVLVGGSASVVQVTVTDTAANVQANLDQLQLLAAKGTLGPITLTDGGEPTLFVTASQKIADSAALSWIASPFILATTANPVSVTVSAYDWKTHALLAGVSVSAVASSGSGNTQPRLDFQSLHLNATGQLVGELFADNAAGAQSLSLGLILPAGVSASFAGKPLPSDWVLSTSGAGTAQFNLAAMGLTGLASSVDLGTLTFALPPTATQVSIEVATAILGSGANAPFVLSYGAAQTGAGQIGAASSVTLSGLLPVLNNLTVSRAAADSGRAITAADALAALKLAIGVNPNLVNPVTGTQPLVSPYQFIAADVNGDGRVTAADALAVLKMAIKVNNAVAPRWIFANEAANYWNPATNSFSVTRSSVPASVTVTASMQAGGGVGLVGVLLGDVNGSYVPLSSTGTPQSTYAMVPANYFPSLSLTVQAPPDQWGVSSYTAATAITALQAGAAGPVSIIDTAANVAASFDALAPYAASGKLSRVWLKDAGTPTLPVTVLQVAQESAMFAALVGTCTISISGLNTLANGLNLAPINEATVLNLGVNGASVTSSLAATALTFSGTPALVSLGSAASTTLQYSLVPGSGVDLISNFNLGLDRLDITLNGAVKADIVAVDTHFGGQVAIYVASAKDISHGIMFAGGFNGINAAQLTTNYFVVSNGHLIIS